MVSFHSFSIALQALLLSPVVSAISLPVVGPNSFDVSFASVPLTDPGRLDPFANDGRPRSIMVTGYYPVAACRQNHNESYMPPTIAAFQDDRFAAYGLPNGSFRSLELETCEDIGRPSSCSSKPFPLVLFSGALGTSRLLYSTMLQSVAAAGYLVISLDHPYDTDIVEFPDGTLIKATNISSDADLELALATRVGDIAFLYDQLRNSSLIDKLFPNYPNRHCITDTAIFGHSFGGATAAAAMLQISSLQGGINIDGTMFGPVLTAGLDRPFVLLGHENKTQETDPSWKTIWPNLTGWKRELEVKGAAHYSFSDLPLIASTLGFQELLPAEVGEVLGTVEGHRMMSLTVTCIIAFLDHLLRSGSMEKLERSIKGFPEVIEVA